jgi:hypothetical protein
MKLILALISAALMAAPAHAQFKGDHKKKQAAAKAKADAKKNKAGTDGLKVDPSVKKLKKAEKK